MNYVWLLVYIPRNNFDDEIRTTAVYSSLEALLRDNPGTLECTNDSTDGNFWIKEEVIS